jgi:hypothetical protein
VPLNARKHRGLADFGGGSLLSLYDEQHDCAMIAQIDAGQGRNPPAKSAAGARLPF